MQRKPIFDALREVLGRGMTQAEVARLDKAIDRALASDAPVLAPSRPSRVGVEGIVLIQQFEGCAKKRRDGMIEAYPDPGTGGEPWTIGWGATDMDGRKVVRGDVITQARADALLEEHLERYSEQVLKAIGDAPTSQPQFDALVSFHYNTGAIASATLTKKHCVGDFEGAAQEFARWNQAAGRVMKGLVRRREAEARLYLSGC